MITFLFVLCITLGILLLLCIIKIFSMRRAAEELSKDFAGRLREDTNVGIDISCSDKKSEPPVKTGGLLCPCKGRLPAWASKALRIKSPNRTISSG